MKTNITKDDIPDYGRNSIDLGSGYSLLVETEYDESMGAPWEEHDGHGKVSEWTTRAKRPGEWVLRSNRHSKRYYDFEDAMKEARKNWGLCDGDKAKLAVELGHAPSVGEIAAEAVRRDFELLRGWANDEWHWIGVVVRLIGPDDEVLSKDSLWGIEDDGDYWREIAAENGTSLIEAHLKELDESAYWAARDVLTV